MTHPSSSPPVNSSRPAEAATPPTDLLAHTILGATDTPDTTVILAHGIMGSRRNWRSFGQRWVTNRPGLRVVIVDLRGHGDSHGLPGRSTVSACAGDLLRLDAHLQHDADTAAPTETTATILVGHSFGGKVCAAAAKRWPRPLHQLWVLDSPLGVRSDDRGVSDVEAVIAAVQALPMPVTQRSDVAKALLSQGFSAALANWMTTNLRRSDTGYVWRFDLDVVAALLADYFVQDHWPSFSFPQAGTRHMMVRGARSDRWVTADLERLRALQHAGRARDFELPDAGHWLHADNPSGLLNLVLTHA